MIRRLFFALKNGTFSKIVIDPNDPDQLIVFHQGHTTIHKRFCPHMGADLKKYSYFKESNLVCSWHGCEFKVGHKKGHRH